jgi:hypothetical protein
MVAVDGKIRIECPHSGKGQHIGAGLPRCESFSWGYVALTGEADMGSEFEVTFGDVVSDHGCDQPVNQVRVIETRLVIMTEIESLIFNSWTGGFGRLAPRVHERVGTSEARIGRVRPGSDNVVRKAVAGSSGVYVPGTCELGKDSIHETETDCAGVREQETSMVLDRVYVLSRIEGLRKEVHGGEFDFAPWKRSC